MTAVIAWCGFLGAWLLVAGPLFQAALELAEEDLQRDELAAATRQIGVQPSVSNWWWLLPPVRYWLQRRQSRRYRQAVVSILTPAQLEGLLSYLNKATGWLLVSLSGTLLGLNETWALCQHLDWPVGVFVLLVLLMVLLCVGNTTARMRRTGSMLRAGVE